MSFTPEQRKKGGYNSKRKPGRNYAREFMEEIANKKTGETRRCQLLEKMHLFACAGEASYAKLLYEQAYGRAKQQIEHSGQIDGTFKVKLPK